MTTNLIAAAIVAFALAYCVNLTTAHASRTNWTADITDIDTREASAASPCVRCAM